MNYVNINGQSIVSSGNISIINGKVMVDGVDQTPNGKTITIEINGNVETLKVDHCQKVTVTGSCTNVTTGSGDVEVGCNVKSGLQTGSGDVKCKDVNGSVKTMSGDVSASSISGSVNTMSGDISKSHR
jgi:DUF4097 and DUF4098 domain-containing protein YvlB